MKINTRRSGISQSMDLFIIIAAVLGVGGVVTAAVYGLVNTASTNGSIAVTQAALTGSSSGVTLGAFSITIKNTGSTTLTGQQLQISFSGTTDSGTAALVGLYSSQNPGGWSALTIIPNPAGLQCNSVTLAPGQTLTVSITSMTGLGSGAPATGTTTTVVVNIGSLSTNVRLTAQ